MSPEQHAKVLEARCKALAANFRNYEDVNQLRWTAMDLLNECAEALSIMRAVQVDRMTEQETRAFFDVMWKSPRSAEFKPLHWFVAGTAAAEFHYGVAGAAPPTEPEVKP